MGPSLRFEFGLIACGVIAVVCGIHGLSITECNNQFGFINNTRPNCSYPYINCSGQDSMFCVDNSTCNAAFNCNETIVSGIPTVSPNNSSTSTSESPNTGLSTASPLNVREQCRQGVTKRFSYPQNCNYFYYCVDGFLLVEQCPFGYAFDASSGACGGRMRGSMDCTLK
ncbi:uncharacterized protein DMAD_05089 [Drosophila madeirensis]|uniref:Chitin-binding type-2 domain-containing protein n=1 Tax=Drosophila madeirensis TaxID=30013 RepID=A0AAU9FKZ8_DROMD|nr:uncharacterized protein LOC117895128 [Drosophila subobscura]